MNTRRTSNVELRTSNVEVNAGTVVHGTSTFDVRRSTFDVPFHSSVRAGFSFAEVMFAVVILGIGFIMVAAIFPVAIQQTQVNGEENIAASVARQAAAAIAAMPMTYPNPIYPTAAPYFAAPDPRSVQYLLTFPPTVKNYVKGTDLNAPDAPPIVVPLVGARWNFSKTISILPSDPRYAYSAFYKRDNGSTSAELIVIAMAVRNRATYSSTLDESSAQQQQSPTPAPANVTLTKGDFTNYLTTAAPLVPNQAQTTICPDILQMNGGYEGYNVQIPPPTSPPLVVSPQPVGRSYSLGRIATNAGALNTFELTAGDGLALTAGSNGKWGSYDAIFDVNTLSTTPPPPPGGPVGYVNQPATMQPSVAYARLFTTPDAPQGRIELNISPSVTDGVPAAATTGAFVIIADDFPAVGTSAVGAAPAPMQDYALPDNIPGSSYYVGAMNGRIFRLGAPVPPTPDNTNATPVIHPGTFNLDPAYGMRPIPPGGSFSPDTLPNPYMVQAANANPILPPGPLISVLGSAKVYIVGVGKTDPSKVTTETTGYSGPAQDIGAFVSYFQVQ